MVTLNAIVMEIAMATTRWRVNGEDESDDNSDDVMDDNGDSDGDKATMAGDDGKWQGQRRWCDGDGDGDGDVRSKR